MLDKRKQVAVEECVIGLNKHIERNSSALTKYSGCTPILVPDCDERNMALI